MRTTPLVFITFTALSLSATGALAGGSWCANYGTGHSGIDCSFKSMEQCLATLSGLSGFCAKSVPRHGLRERRDLELIAGYPRSRLPSRALAAQTILANFSSRPARRGAA